MQHETEVGLVEAHTERTRRDERLHLVALEHALRFLTLIGVGLPGVRAHLMAALAQQPGGVDGRGDGERVDDARSWQVVDMAEQPGQPAGRIGKAQHAESQGCAGERAADREHTVVGHVVSRARDPELLLDVGDDPAVRRRRRGEHRHLRRHLRDEVAQAPVVRAEVVTPVADAVRLVDDEHADAAHERRQLLLTEGGVVQPLRRHQQHVDLVAVELGEHVAPFVRVRRVDRHRAHAGAFGRRDLVTHQRQQRRDEHRGTGALPAQQQGRDEVDGGLSPAGPLHHERPPPLGDQRLDRFVLPLMEVGIGAADEIAQCGEGGSANVDGREGGHAPTLPQTTDTGHPTPLDLTELDPPW